MRPYTPWWGCSIEFHASFIFWMNSCRRRKYLLSHSRDSCVPHRHQMITPRFLGLPPKFRNQSKVGSCYTSTHMTSDGQSIGVSPGITGIMKLIDIQESFNALTRVWQIVLHYFWLAVKSYYKQVYVHVDYFSALTYDFDANYASLQIQLSKKTNHPEINLERHNKSISITKHQVKVRRDCSVC